MWHDIIKNPHDLPMETRMYLVRYRDGAMCMRYFIKKNSRFISDGVITAWTDCFLAPDSSCAVCDKARWRNLFGTMFYICDSVYRAVTGAEAPRKEAV